MPLGAWKTKCLIPIAEMAFWSYPPTYWIGVWKKEEHELWRVGARGALPGPAPMARRSRDEEPGATHYYVRMCVFFTF